MNARRERAKAQNAQLNKQPERAKPNRVDQRIEKLGDYFVDVSKYVLTGVVFSSMFKELADRASLYIVGLFIVVFALWAGLILKNKYKE